MGWRNKFLSRILNSGLVNVFVTIAVMACGIYLFDNGGRKQYLLLCSVLLAAVIALNFFAGVLKRKLTAGKILQMPFYREVNEKGLATVRNFRIPMIFINEQGDLIWNNDEFKDLFEKGDALKRVHSLKRTVKELFLLRIRSRLLMGESDLSMEVSFAGRHFLMMGNAMQAGDGKDGSLYIMLYFVDITQQQILKQRAEDSALAVGTIVIDCYEEIYQSDGEAVINQVTVELGKIFDKWLNGKPAVVRKLVRDRYILLIENKYLRELESDRFEILNKAKEISVGNRNTVTLSIGISLQGESVAENYRNAEAACELALGRGGDQVVIRQKGKDTYYGGSSVEIERRTKVKARVIASLLKNEILKSSKVLIMGHANADMDALGAALAVYRACCICKVSGHIILNESNRSIDTIIQKINSLGKYEDVFIDTSEALNLIDNRTLVVVVDTYKQAMTECPKLLDYASRVAVIDHHRRGADFIKDTVLFYSETYASSTSELLVEVLNYFTNNVRIPKIEAEAMYAGIWVDTKSFTFKTGIRTFETASFLRGQGVDTVAVRRYFQPDFDTFSQVWQVASSTEIINGNIAVAVCGPEVANPSFIAALAADQMLTVSEVDASFVLSVMGNAVSISGRSLGDINVQVILEKMGGGGHLTAAGTQIEGVSLQEAKRDLIANIEAVIHN